MNRNHPNKILFYLLIYVWFCVVLMACVNNKTTDPESVEMTNTSLDENESLGLESTTRVTATPHIYKMEVKENSYISPNKRWKFTAIQALPYSEWRKDYSSFRYDKLILTDLTGGEEGVIKNEWSKYDFEWVIKDEWSKYDFGGGSVRPLAWSADGEYLYITDDVLPEQWCYETLHWGSVFKIKLSTIEWFWFELSPALGWWIALSPDETIIASVYSCTVNFWNITNQNWSQEIVLGEHGDCLANHLLWSPDQTAIILSISIPACKPQASSIFLIDMVKREPQVLVAEDARFFVPVAWDEPERVLLRDKDGKEWWLDPDSGGLAEKP